MNDSLKRYLNAALSVLLLLPVSIALENSDGLEVVNSIGEGLKEWISAFMLSMLLSIVPVIAISVLKKNIGYLMILTITNYILSALILFVLFILPIL